MAVIDPRFRSRILLVPIAVVLALSSLWMAAPAGADSTWQKGDVFLGVNNGEYQVRAPDGTLKETLRHDSAQYFTTGCGFDAGGNFYGTYFLDHALTRFEAASPHEQSDIVAADPEFFPESVAFDAAGNLYVGASTGIWVFDPDGTSVRRIVLDRVDHITLAVDGETILYTHEGTSIMRVAISTGDPLPDFSTDTATSAHAVLALPDGKVLLADKNDIKLYGVTGEVIKTYDVDGRDHWYGLALDPDGSSFWATDYMTDTYYRFDIDASGAPLASLDIGGSGLHLYGICVYPMDPPTYYEACLHAGTLTKVGYIGESANPSVNCGRGAPVVLLAGDDIHACLYAGSLSQVGTEPPANCGRGAPVELAAGDNLLGCLYAGQLTQIGYDEPGSCGRGEPIGLALVVT